MPRALTEFVGCALLSGQRCREIGQKIPEQPPLPSYPCQQLEHRFQRGSYHQRPWSKTGCIRQLHASFTVTGCVRNKKKNWYYITSVIFTSSSLIKIHNLIAYLIASILPHRVLFPPVLRQLKGRAQKFCRCRVVTVRKVICLF